MWTKTFNSYKKFANFVGRINTKVILTLFYFTIIPVFKLFSLFIKQKKTRNTNWKIKEKSDPNSFRTPVYPGFLFLSRFLLGSYKAALVIQSVLIVLSAYLLYLIGREYFSRKIAFWSAGIFLFTPFSLNVSVKFLTQTPFLFLLILSIWSWVQFLKNQRNKYFLLTSILLPVLALTRPR